MSAVPVHRPAVPAGEHAQLTATGIRLVRGSRTVLDGLDLTITPTTRLGVVGENGRGKTSLLEVDGNGGHASSGMRSRARPDGRGS